MVSNVNLLPSLAKRLHPHLRGQLAEKLALAYYLIHGWLPVNHLRQTLAQTDIIVIKGTTIALVEVKFRTTSERAHLAITPVQKQRLQRQMLAVSGRYPGYTIRLEVFLVFPHKPFFQRIPQPYVA